MVNKKDLLGQLKKFRPPVALVFNREEIQYLIRLIETDIRHTGRVKADV